jgi:transcriptional regulator with XRE-family HTH domain
MKKPDSNEHRTGDTAYLRSLIEKSGFSQRELARMIGVNERTMRSWLSGKNEYPYLIQYILENLEETEETTMPSVNEVQAESGVSVGVEYAHFMWSAAAWVASSALRAGRRPEKDSPLVCDDLPDLEVVLHTTHESWNPWELDLEVRRKNPTEHPAHIKVRCHFNEGRLSEGALSDEMRISKKMRSAPAAMSTGIAKEVGLRHFARFVTEI